MPAPIDLATRQQVYLERLKSGLVRDYGTAQESLRRRVREVLTALETDNLGTLTRKEISTLILQLREAQTGVTFAAMDAFLDQLPGFAQYAAGLELVQLGKMIFPTPRFNAPTAELAYQAALRNPVQATGELLEPFVKNWATADALRVGNTVRNGWAQGKTLSQMVREVIGTKAGGYKDGILETSRRGASTVIHTATQHVANAARQSVWEANGDIVEKYQWVSTLDRRTTQQCKSLDGRQFEPGKGPMPPIHPNCRSTTIAVLGKEWDWLDEGGTRASSGPNPGYVPAGESYYDWLGKQPEAFQKVALGPTRAKLFADGGLTADRFAELNLGRDFEPLTLSEMRLIEPEAFKRAGL
jgi:SPP1 gp7 family putative phage head morphogenesis protein